MKKIITIFFIFCCFKQVIIAQTTIHSASFETGLNGWTQSTSDDMDWTRQSGGTPSSNTGPSVAASGNYYLFTEASSNSNKKAILVSPSFTLNGSNPLFTFYYHMYGADMGSLYVEISTDGGITYPTILWSKTGQVQTSNGAAWLSASLDLSTYIGKTVKIRFQGVVGNGYRSDMAIDNISLTLFPYTSQEINLKGNGNTILSGDITPSIADNTDFGTVNVGTSTTKTYTIQNFGPATLNLTGTPIVSGTGSSAFTITQPPSNSIASGGADLTFSVTYNPTAIGLAQFDISIPNNDTTGGENPYTFRIIANADQNFFDSDGDGIFDNIDIDDDNDGIKDTDEELNCRKSSVAGVANYKYLNETFGTLPPGARTTINTSYNATTTYCYEPGTGSGSSCGTSWILDDGEYVVVSKITGTSASDPQNIHGNLAWTNVLDHTPGDGDSGGMAVFNAAWAPGIFYETTIKGVLPNVPISYSFWVLNIMAQSTYPGSILPNVTVEFWDISGTTLLSSINTGQFGRCSTNVNDNSCTDNVWLNFSRNDINIGNRNAFIVRFKNNAPGGGGNDLALDDIVISQTLCDSDKDGVADVFDLDSDNDGIPDVVESGNAIYSNGTAKIPAGIFTDSNGNGMNDASESIIPFDTDGDGVPNYVDLDSDNDGIFDVDESGVVSSGAPSGTQNGDGDINGDGTGDGLDTDAHRETDINSDGILEYFTDGILDMYDYYNGVTFTNSYGNVGQGTGPLYVKDTDNDGIPDYMDVKSNGSTFDIASTLYSNANQTLAGLPVLDANNDGVIDNATDTDGDGIPDLFDTDNTKFGSPRNLNRKLELYFDGRNDYAEEEGLNIVNGLSQATMMAWVKLDPTFSTDGAIMGQNNFWIKINSSKKLFAEVNGYQITAPVSSALALNTWTHVAAVYDGSNAVATVKLYVNGVKVDSTNTAGMRPIINTSTNTKFRIGRTPASISFSTGEMFKGYLDEVRVFDKALSADELHKMIYQEIQNNTGNVSGSVIPRNITNYVNTTTSPISLPWANLKRYYRMDAYKDDIIDDLTTPSIDIGIGAKIYNMKIIDPQTAPLPFITQTTGSLPTAVNIPANGVNGNDAATFDWSIVDVKHDITYNATQKHLGLIVESPNKFSIQSDTELNVSWYLKLDGFIDLEGESQLVQGDDSILDQNSGGYIERDQQGTANSFNYNYWTSSVGPITAQGAATGTASTNADFTISGVLEDGTNPSSPLTINFGAPYTWADSGIFSPIKISTYWLYTFNGTNNNYGSWAPIDQNTSLSAGQGYTMKGTSGSVPLTTQQNYIFKGKPYNGTVNLTIAAGNDRLIGNPYPSAIDANEFILDNISTANGGRNTTGNIFNGAIYFWDHFGKVDSHYLADYVGGYATYTLMGGAKAYANDTRINATGGSGTKIPKRYIPLNQGFFVIAVTDTLTNSLKNPIVINGGNIVFKNSQRIFKTEGSGSSLFMKSASNKKVKPQPTIDEDDIRPKIWLEYTSPEGYHRQLLVGVDENTTNHFDLGFDGLIADLNKEDMFWTIDGGKFVIQAVNNFDKQQEFPFGLKVAQDGMVSIKIDSLSNIKNNLKLFIKDSSTGETYKINDRAFEMNLAPGDYENRFSLVFQPRLKSPNEIKLTDGIYITAQGKHAEIIISKIIDTKILAIRVSNSLGQTVCVRTNNLNDREISIPLKTNLGVYFVQIYTSNGVINKKVFLGQ